MSSVPSISYIRDLRGDFDRAVGSPAPEKTLGEIVSKFEELRAEFKQARVDLQLELDRLAAAALEDADSPDVCIFQRMRNIAALRCQELHELMKVKKAEIATLEQLQIESATRVEAAEAAVLAHDQATAAKALTRSKRKVQATRVAGLGNVEAGAANWNSSPVKRLRAKARGSAAPIAKEMRKEESEKK